MPEDTHHSPVRVSSWNDQLERRMWFEITEDDTEESPLRVTSGGPHEEGYSYTEEVYHMDEEGVVWLTASTQSQDCDGRMDSGGEYKFVPNHGWERVNSSQRDHTAEAMGY